LAAQTASRVMDFPTYALGAPVVALGGAGTAWAHDASGSLNPATLLGAPRVSLYHFEGYADYAGDLAAGSISIGERIALGVNVRRFGWDRIIEDDLGIPTDGLRTGDAQYSATVAVAPARRIRVGVALSRLVSDNLGVRISATSWSAGALARYAEDGYVGVAVLHAGAAAQGVGGERYPLPTAVRAGVRQRLPRRLAIVLDGEWLASDARAWSAHTGLEWRAPAFLILRAGIASVKSTSAVERDTRLASGVGVLVGPLEISLSTRFGGIAGSQEWFVGLDALRARPRS
jgi:hypothetical protein